ncbi:MAG: T9SS type A sorting domain-containing protein [Candidatus Neomarinimicrobiota bacterium]
MKSFRSVLTLTVFITFVFSQLDTLHYGDFQSVVPNPFSESTNTDWPNQKGYVTGTNVYRDIGKYQRFEFYSSNYIIGAVLYFGLVDIDASGVADTITVVLKGISNIASDSTEGVFTFGPSETNLASAKVTLDQVDTTGIGTLVMFDQAVQMAGDDFMADSFFIGIEWELTDHLDTFALYSDSIGAELGDGFNRAWEKFEDGNYNDFGCILSPSYCWGYDIDMWIGAVHSSDVAAIDDYDVIFPNEVIIHNAYPNPFNPVTYLRYDLPQNEMIKITIYDMMGRIVKTLVNSFQTAGYKTIQWNATDNKNEPISAGLYLYTIQAGEFRQTKKIVLLK